MAALGHGKKGAHKSVGAYCCQAAPCFLDTVDLIDQLLFNLENLDTCHSFPYVNSRENC